MPTRDPQQAPNSRPLVVALMIVGAVLALAGLSIDGRRGNQPGAGTSDPRTLTLAAYTTPRDAYDNEILPAFVEWWAEQTGEEVAVATSYQGSGGQSRAIVGGFEADVAALSLEPDLERIADAGLITHDWRADPWDGMVTASMVILAVRTGNPKSIRGWEDLARDDVEVLTPNIRTSGGAMWNTAAMFGAAERGFTSARAGDEEDAVDFVAGILARVRIMDKGARESILTFEQGIGDVAITYENEVLTARLAGRNHDYVVPRSTIRIVNPVAVIDVSVDRHGNRDLAEAFVSFLRLPEIQRIFARYGYRPILPGLEADLEQEFSTPEDLFTIDDLGGWTAAVPRLFDPGGLYDRALGRAGPR